MLRPFPASWCLLCSLYCTGAVSVCCSLGWATLAYILNVHVLDCGEPNPLQTTVGKHQHGQWYEQEHVLSYMWRPTFLFLSELELPSDVFARIEAPVDAEKIMMSRADISEDRTRADTPDSGGGGYFTLSESDSGSNLGTTSLYSEIQWYLQDI